MGISDINTPEELAKVKRCIVEAVAPDGYAVLNANDPLVVEMAAHCPGGVVFFAIDPNHPVIVRHRGVGGRAIFVRDGQVILAEGDREEPIVSLARLPLTRGGQVAFQVENSLASIAAAWSLGIPKDLIRARAESIAADIDKVPGRFNVLEIEGTTVVVDYGHNAHSLAAVIEAIDKFPHARRIVPVYDRRRPPRHRHHPPGRIARRRLRPRRPLRGPLSPRPGRRRDHGPAPQRVGSPPLAPRRSSRS